MTAGKRDRSSRGPGAFKVTKRPTLKMRCLFTGYPYARDRPEPLVYKLSNLEAATLTTYLLVHHGSFKPKVHNLRGGLSPHLLKRTLDYIHEQSTGELHLQELARLCCLSSSQFSKSFRLSVGVTPYQFVLQVKMKTAETLLRAKHLSIGEIAQATGFKSQQHFAFAFRRITGYSPSDYRSRL